MNANDKNMVSSYEEQRRIDRLITRIAGVDDTLVRTMQSRTISTGLLVYGIHVFMIDRQHLVRQAITIC